MGAARPSSSGSQTVAKRARISAGASASQSRPAASGRRAVVVRIGFCKAPPPSPVKVEYTSTRTPARLRLGTSYSIISTSLVARARASSRGEETCSRRPSTVRNSPSAEDWTMAKSGEEAASSARWTPAQRLAGTSRGGREVRQRAIASRMSASTISGSPEEARRRQRRCWSISVEMIQPKRAKSARPRTTKRGIMAGFRRGRRGRLRAWRRGVASGLSRVRRRGRPDG